MCVLGAVFADRVIVQPLTDYIWLGLHPLHNSEMWCVARRFKALAVGLQTSDEFYKALLEAVRMPNLFTSPSLTSTQWYVPIFSLFNGRFVDKFEILMPETPETSGGEVEHDTKRGRGTVHSLQIVKF
jgi:hypothetical protein